MKASELIKRLQELTDKFGDKDVFMYIAMNCEYKPDCKAMSEVDSVSVETYRMEEAKFFEIFGVD